MEVGALATSSLVTFQVVAECLSWEGRQAGRQAGGVHWGLGLTMCPSENVLSHLFHRQYEDLVCIQGMDREGLIPECLGSLSHHPGDACSCLPFGCQGS